MLWLTVYTVGSAPSLIVALGLVIIRPHRTSMLENPCSPLFSLIKVAKVALFASRLPQNRRTTYSYYTLTGEETYV